MNLPNSSTPSADLSDLDLAILVADNAGKMLQQLQTESLAGGMAAAQLKGLGDSRSQRLISSALRASRPNDMVLSEEAIDDRHRLGADRVWIIDPLDGTKEFAEGRTDWAVHVALWVAGSLTIGVVALPGTGEIFHSGMARLEGRPKSKPTRLAVSRSRPSPLAAAVAESVEAELVPMGSAGYKIGAVIRGDVDAYLHSGGQYEWDSAAPVAAALSQGLHASRIDGSALTYNQPNPYLPDLLVCRPELAPALLAGIQKFGREEVHS